MDNNVNSHFLKIEMMRDILAKKGKYKDLKKLYLQDIIPKNSNNRSFWNKKIKKERLSIKKSPIYIDKINQVSKYVNKLSGNLLDVGVGYGDVEKQLITRTNLHLYGIDLSDHAIKWVTNKYKGIYQVGNILNLPFEFEFFDIVVCLDVLEHIEPTQIFKAYKNIFNVLRRGGIFIVSVPLNEDLHENNNPNGHLRIYTQNILKAELRMAGFDVLETKLLYAFKNYYLLKSFTMKYLPIFNKKPNLCIVFARKK